MSQMVLPQTPAPGMQNEPGQPRAGGSRDSGDQESRFEAVSRAEQKRLDQRQAEKRDQHQTKTDPSSEARDTPDNTDATTRPEKSGDARQSASADRPGDDAVTGDETGQSGAGEAGQEADIVTAPLTFVELQSLLMPETVPAASATAAPLAGVAGVLAPGQRAAPGLLPGPSAARPGQPGLLGQTAPGLTSGLQLAEALTAGLSADSSRPVDPVSLSGGARFQSAMELAPQQLAAQGAAKLSAETAVPLRAYATSIDVPVGHAEWGDKLVGKLSWLTVRNLSVAEIHLTPPDMGPMEVKVRVQNDQANITVHSANPVVRDQLELHSHRLRDMLSEQGMSLAQFDVSDQSGNQTGGHDADQGDHAQGGRGPALGEATDGLVDTGHLDLSWKGEVDIFA